MVAIGSLLLIVAISLLITRVATVILTASGMSRESARFQARSAFTGCGFTTSEAEAAVDHPVRRRVVATLMLLGNAGIVAAASSAIIGFRHGALGQQSWRILELAVGLLALVFLSRSQWVDRRLTALIGRFVHRYTDTNGRDLAGLLKLSGDYTVSELAIREGDWVANRRLGDLELREEGIAVLGITRADGNYLGAPAGNTEICPGDVLLVYGLTPQLRELDSRAAGPDGDRAHARARSRNAAGRRDVSRSPA